MRLVVPSHIFQAPLADGEDPSSAAAGDSAGDTAGGVASTPSHAAAAAAATTGTGTGRYELDLSFGGPGCTADGGWEAGEWRRVPRAAHVNGKSYLPNWGRNITTVVVRWVWAGTTCSVCARSVEYTY